MMMYRKEFYLETNVESDDDLTLVQMGCHFFLLSDDNDDEERVYWCIYVWLIKNTFTYTTNDMTEPTDTMTSM